MGDGGAGDGGGGAISFLYLIISYKIIKLGVIIN